MAVAAPHAAPTRPDAPIKQQAPAPRSASADAGAPAASAPWTDPSGRPNRNARDALGLLASAGEDGLDPADYDAAPLAAAAAALDAADAPPDSVVTAFNARLGASVLGFLRELHLGRVDPRAVGFRVSARRDVPDFDRLLQRALAAGDLQPLVAHLRPRAAPYAALSAALARYRRLAADPGLELPAGLRAPVKPGATSPGLAMLQRRLIAFGDLASNVSIAADPVRYDGSLVEAVRRFQQRHGLQSDGLIGPATLAALRVPASRRVLQIALALERLRWLPPLQGQRFIAVNIPMFRLWAAGAGGTPPVAMGVIVGQALRTPTPVFIAELREMVLRPYWNVPRSIVRGELLPLIERDPTYLARHEMEIVRGAGDDAPVVEANAANIALLRAGALRLRQRPGPRNALGLVKFSMPNAFDIYLHDTPAHALFDRSRRDFSHGCVRVEDAMRLAEWALQDLPRWSRERIAEAAAEGSTRTVRLARPLPVVVYYLTAMAVPGSARIRFADDIYGHDARLAKALAARAAR